MSSPSVGRWCSVLETCSTTWCAQVVVAPTAPELRGGRCHRRFIAVGGGHRRRRCGGLSRGRRRGRRRRWARREVPRWRRRRRVAAAAVRLRKVSGGHGPQSLELFVAERELPLVLEQVVPRAPLGQVAAPGHGLHEGGRGVQRGRRAAAPTLCIARTPLLLLLLLLQNPSLLRGTPRGGGGHNSYWHSRGQRPSAKEPLLLLLPRRRRQYKRRRRRKASSSGSGSDGCIAWGCAELHRRKVSLSGS
mmetsp:Transcript_53848/g.92658  ORF Transcript_53848/g.92658 Transcript_53848/m.92658 type:complete len:247 (+) Transcript_53848:189-929(+)